ncbi:MAG: KH domain-containing protein [Lachnospiraceae bacterium]|nr:KH domain-containing protein [Lachnospiraceae bacterium]
MKELVEVIAKALVEHPEEVVVTQKQEGKNIRINLSVAPSDMGKVIGRQGRIAKSIRAVVKAASAMDGTRVDVDITDKVEA